MFHWLVMNFWFLIFTFVLSIYPPGKLFLCIPLVSRCKNDHYGMKFTVYSRCNLSLKFKTEKVMFRVIFIWRINKRYYCYILIQFLYVRALQSSNILKYTKGKTLGSSQEDTKLISRIGGLSLQMEILSIR